MKNSTIIKLIALNREVTASEEIFTIKELKDKYPKLWLILGEIIKFLLIRVWINGLRNR